jgi:cyclic lactone autoinducer peptide
MLKYRMYSLLSLAVAFVATFSAFSPASVVFLNEPEVPQELQK